MYHLRHWRPEQATFYGSDTYPCVSIVIVARDEAAHIGDTLQAIVANDYPAACEIILVDDHSTDDTVQIARGLGIPHLKIISLEAYDTSSYGSAYKKAGQYHGVQAASYDIILTTDADCRCGAQWIRSMVEAQTGVEIATGLIDIQAGGSILGLLQRYDNIATMMTTAVGIKTERWYSANAANMIWHKSIYQDYLSSMNTGYASGDDVMFLQWVATQGRRVGFVKDIRSIVKTGGMDSWSGLYGQRLRWATKTAAYVHKALGFLWIMIFLFHLSVLMAVVAALTAGSHELMVASIILVMTKVLTDMLMLREGGDYFGYRYPMLLGPLLSLIHSAYIIIIGISSLWVKEYTWKGRRVT